MRASFIRKPPPSAAINLGHPLARDLVGAWDFLEAGPVVRDHARRYGDGAIVGAPAYTTGPGGNALALLAASSQYVSIPSNANYLLERSYSIHLRFLLTAVRNYDRIWSKADATIQQPRPWDSYVDGSGTITIPYGAGVSGGNGGSLSGPITGGVWHDLFITYDDQQPDASLGVGASTYVIAAYIDGSPIATASGTITNPQTGLDAGNAIGLGAFGNGGTVYMNGSISLFRIWLRRLTPAEVQLASRTPWVIYSRVQRRETSVTSSPGTVSAVVCSATAGAPAPTWSAAVLIAGVAGQALASAVEFEGGPPVVTGAATITGAVGQATAAAPAPAVGTGAVVDPPAAQATAGAPAPAVTGLTAATVDPPAAQATASAPVPVVGITGTVTAVVGAATADAPAPTIEGDTAAKVDAPAAQASADAAIPDLSFGFTVLAVPAQATAAFLAPIVSTTASIYPSPFGPGGASGPPSPFRPNPTTGNPMPFRPPPII